MISTKNWLIIKQLTISIKSISQSENSPQTRVVLTSRLKKKVAEAMVILMTEGHFGLESY